MMCKKTNEYQLRRMLGPQFAVKYQRIVQRLINIGILVRNVDGYLEVNEAVVGEVTELLAHAKYIHLK